MSQELFNIVLAVAGVLGGWALKTIWDEVKSLQAADVKLTEKVSTLQVLVAGQYIRREDFDRVTTEIFKKLEEIKEKLYEKADRP